MKKNIGQLNIAAKKGGVTLFSMLDLVIAIAVNSFWLMSRSLKMVFILNKEMFACLTAFRKRKASSCRNVFHRHGLWIIDLNELIHEQMGIK